MLSFFMDLLTESFRDFYLGLFFLSFEIFCSYISFSSSIVTSYLYLFLKQTIVLRIGQLQVQQLKIGFYRYNFFQTRSFFLSAFEKVIISKRMPIKLPITINKIVSPSVSKYPLLYMIQSRSNKLVLIQRISRVVNRNDQF